MPTLLPVWWSLRRFIPLAIMVATAIGIAWISGPAVWLTIVICAYVAVGWLVVDRLVLRMNYRFLTRNALVLDSNLDLVREVGPRGVGILDWSFRPKRGWLVMPAEGKRVVIRFPSDPFSVLDRTGFHVQVELVVGGSVESARQYCHWRQEEKLPNILQFLVDKTCCHGGIRRLYNAQAGGSDMYSTALKMAKAAQNDLRDLFEGTGVRVAGVRCQILRSELVQATCGDFTGPVVNRLT